MTLEKPPDNNKADLQEKLLKCRPTMNWNRASSGAIRTFLRSSRNASASHAPLSAGQTDSTVLEADQRVSASSSKVDASPEPATAHDYSDQDASLDGVLETTNLMVPNESTTIQTPGYDLPLPAGFAKSRAMNEDSTDALRNEHDPVSKSRDSGLALDGMHEQENRSSGGECRLYISNAPDTVTTESIRALFSRFHVTGVGIRHVPDQPENEIYVDVVDAFEAQHAIHSLNGKEVSGQKLHVDLVPNVPNNKTVQSNKHRSPAAVINAVMALSNPQSPPEGSNGNNSKLSSVRNSRSGTEEGEITDDTGGGESEKEDSPADQSHTRVSEDHIINEIVVVDSDEDDAMVTNYADAQQVARPINTSNPNNSTEVIEHEDANGNVKPDRVDADTELAGPRTLGDLTIPELELQLRYFYYARDPVTIPESDPVHCLVCAGIGHWESQCPAQICSHCNAKGVHFSKNCPKITRCNRCRGRHPIRDCKHKLRPQNLQFICDLCNETGHVEGDCELNWRSSGPIWKKSLQSLGVDKSCFICGDFGHLGNDCQLRRPGKQMGSSMWSEKGLPEPFASITSSLGKDVSAPLIVKKKNKMPNSKAKGMAGAHTKSSGAVQSPASLADDDNSQGSRDLGRKIKGRAAPANIQIKGLANRTNLDSRAYSDPYSPAPLSAQYRGYQENQHPNYRDGYQNSSSNFIPSDRYYDDDGQGDFIRGRFGNNRYRSRSRSRSRSPRGWYRSPPRSAGYNTSRDYRERDNSSFYNGGNTRRQGGR